MISKKVPASTLPEVLISLVIILAVFTIAITIYTRITFSGVSLTKGKALAEANAMITEARESGDRNDQTVSRDSVVYRKTVSPYPGYKDLYLLSIEAEQNGRQLVQVKQVVRFEE